MWWKGRGVQRCGRLATAWKEDSGEARLTKCDVPLRTIDMDLIYLAIVAVFFLLSGCLISVLDRL